MICGKVIDEGSAYDTAVAGAGASGLMAAITAARAGMRTVLIEHTPDPAKKLLATGNGRCNYTNAVQDLNNYYCEDKRFVPAVLEQFPAEAALAFFSELGVRPVQKNGSCIYPESGQASSVRDVLLEEARRLQIPFLLSADIKNISFRKQEARFEFEFEFEIEIEVNAAQKGKKTLSICSRTLILATGGKASPRTGSDGSGYRFAQKLGHTLIPPLPALTALTAEKKQWELPAGVRMECRAALDIEGKQAACERGELQITAYGLSGIVIFQFSRFAARALAGKKTVCVRLDFKPDMVREELSGYLMERMHSVYQASKTLERGFTGFLPEKLIPAIIKRAALKKDMPCRMLQKEQAERLAAALKAYSVTINGTKDFDFAQVTTGGVPVHEIDPQTLGSRLVRGLFFAGEMIDVDAKCGGYNLQWAWASGFAAGFHAAELASQDAPDKMPAKKKRDYDQDFTDPAAVKAYRPGYRKKSKGAAWAETGRDVYHADPKTVHRRKKKK